MAKLVAFYSRADENYFGGQYRYIEVGNTEKVANMISEITGAKVEKGLAIHGSSVDNAKNAVEKWLK